MSIFIRKKGGCEVDRDRFNFKINRMAKNITLREIAEYIGCSIALISKFENDERNMSYEKFHLYKYFIDHYEEIQENRKKQEKNK